jgi:hypothetical protein
MRVHTYLDDEGRVVMYEARCPQCDVVARAGADIGSQAELELVREELDAMLKRHVCKWGGA